MSLNCTCFVVDNYPRVCLTNNYNMLNVVRFTEVFIKGNTQLCYPSNLYGKFDIVSVAQLLVSRKYIFIRKIPWGVQQSVRVVGK